jgi:tetratricopeptide (TPR) repeat protein
VAEEVITAPESDDKQAGVLWRQDVDSVEASLAPAYPYHVEEMIIEPTAAQPQDQLNRSPVQVDGSIWMSGRQIEDSNSWLELDDQAVPNGEILTAELASEQEFQEDIEYQQAAFEDEPYSSDDCAVESQNCEVSSRQAEIKVSPFIAEETVQTENRQDVNVPLESMPGFADENYQQVLIKTNEKLKDETESLPPIVSVEPAPKADPERIAGTIASYEVVVKQNPQNVRAWDSLGNLYRITQRNSDAIHAFERAVALEPNKYVYHYQLGTLYAAEGNYTDAIREIQKVVELNTSFIFAHCALASYLRKIGRDGDAQQHIEIALPYMTSEKEYDRACFESIRGNIDKALELLTIALEKKQTTIEWIRRDLDLDFIRQDSRYKLFETRFSQSVFEY